MDIKILHLIEGARQAEGLTVVIDVFRAFSLECYMYACGAKKVLPCGTVEEAFALRDRHPEYILCGERNGIKVEGFDYGNSPSEFEHLRIDGKTVIHTTSAGVQGLVNVPGADEVITGALVNAAAIARYIRSRDPEKVSLVAMGWNGVKRTEEDELCAEYIRSLLMDEKMANIDKLADDLRYTEGKKFFDPAQNHVFPNRDFFLCTMTDRFDGVIRVSSTEGHLETEWIGI